MESLNASPLFKEIRSLVADRDVKIIAVVGRALLSDWYQVAHDDFGGMPEMGGMPDMDDILRSFMGGFEF